MSKLPSGWIFRARVVNKGTEIQVDQEELITCGECVYFKRDVAINVEGVPIPLLVAHEVCTKWGGMPNK